ncbi:MAG: TIM barrel protein [Nanoarchaeota archaeon]|nr:TIM barrel protein [Nanoarchaeota archaeon]
MAATISFKPQYMKVGVLTAALQELTPREVRDADPDKAIEDWLIYARDLGADCIQLSSAIHPTLSDIPAEAMLDPVANHLDLRSPFNRSRAERVGAAVKESNVAISDIGYFDNHLHPNKTIREQKYNHMIGVMDTAQMLGVPAVCGFVGADPTKDLDQNLALFDQLYIPILQAAKDRGLEFRVEHCPMPGWNTTDRSINNLAYSPGLWTRLHQRAEKAGVGDQFRIHYDPSHTVLQGQDTRDIFAFLNDKGYGFLIAGFHVKGNIIIPEGLAEWSYSGQTVERGDRVDGQPHPDPSKQGGAWLKQVAIAEHELPGTAYHNPIAYIMRRQVDWLDHQLAARELLPLKAENTPLIVEHEYPKARIQDKERLSPILQGSLAYVRSIDRAAADQHALHQVLESQGIPVQGSRRQPYGLN